MMSGTLRRKGFSRMYVDKPEEVRKAEAIIKGLDECEFEYMPEDWVTLSSAYPDTVYTGKFDDLDMNALTAECWKSGVRCWVFDAPLDLRDA